MGLTTTSIAALVLLVVAYQTLVAWRAQPGAKAQEEFVRIWRSGPWAKQFYLDFGGLEIVLALWMVSHAMAHGGWWLVVACIAAMPIFGAMSAALYWIVAVAT